MAEGFSGGWPESLEEAGCQRASPPQKTGVALECGLASSKTRLSWSLAAAFLGSPGSSGTSLLHEPTTTWACRYLSAVGGAYV